MSFIHTTLKKVEICLIKVDMTFRGGRGEEREKGFMFVFKKMTGFSWDEIPVD